MSRLNQPRLLLSGAWCIGLFALAALFPACSGPAVPPEKVFGDLAALRGTGLSSADLGPYLALSRAVVSGDAQAPSGMERLPGVRVFLTAHEPGEQAQVATGKGSTLAASVMEAARILEVSGEVGPGARLRLDVVESAQRSRIEEKQRIPPAEIGIFGYLVVREGAPIGYVLPEEVIYLELYKTGKRAGLRRDKVFKLAAERAGVPASGIAEWPVYRFTTLSSVESEPPGTALPLFRGMVRVTDLPGSRRLMEAARAGADYLVHEIDEKGRYTYNYWAAKDKTGRSYNMLRHCGTTYALLEAYEVFQDPRYLEAAERALRYVKARLHERPGWVETRAGLHGFLHLIDEEKGELSKTGGAGLALIALAKHAAVASTEENLDIMRGLAKYVVHMQEENGHFKTYFQYIPDKDVPDKEVLYYPGEAMLGLMRLYAMDPDPRWLDAAEKAAGYLIHTRDAGLTEADIQHDHWLTMALNELYRVSRVPDYSEHAFKITRAILRNQKTGADAAAPDFVGSFYKLPYTTPASTRLEAYVAAIKLARFVGKDDAELVQAAREVARFVVSQQFDRQNAFFLPDPARAKGGVRESIANNNIRIDYVQHAVSGMLGLARVLADANVGKRTIPGAVPVRVTEDGGDDEPG